MSNELVIASATDSQETVNAAANNDEAAARVPAPKPEIEQLDGSTTVSFEHPRSERTLLAERLAQHKRDLEVLTSPEADSEQIASTEPTSEEAAAEPEPDNIDLEAVRQTATADAIAEGRRRNGYYAPQQAQHLAPVQLEIDALRAELLPAFQEKVNALLTNTDRARIKESEDIPLSQTVRDCLITPNGGAEAYVYLARNPAEVRKIAAMPEHLAILHIAQLTTQLNPALQRRASSAPAPIKPIGGSPTTSAVALDTADYQTFKREREKQIKAARRR